MTYKNVLVLMSDEHSRAVVGCYGNELVMTPNLDALASRGTRFAHAYTNSPICVPARAAFATGRYVFENACWDNAQPYKGEPESWGHALRRRGVGCVSVGKLHYRRESDDTGFDEQFLPMHVVGDVLGAVRDPPPERPKSKAVATEIGPGESSYTAFDRAVTDKACQWLGSHGSKAPWAMFVGWVAPHFPLISPPDTYSLYSPPKMPMPKLWRPEQWPLHPWLDAFRKSFNTDTYFTETTRQIALASYYGLVTFMDRNLGRVLAALERCGAANDTLVIYSSDHGDNLGSRGLWGKSTMYEESVGVPMLIAGASIPAGRCSSTPVSLIDLHPTILDAVGIRKSPGTAGESLIGLAQAPDASDRAVFSEYHAAGAVTGVFMLRKGRHKYIHYVGMRPQLFDLESDPQELNDIACNFENATLLDQLEQELRAICSPEQVDENAKRDQASLVSLHGGRAAVVAKGGFGATPVPG